ncbi:DNA repair protein RadA [Alicyclobacillus macrosporangiidus]|uniref:DNA repair protein RadA n=1 Tax=Alicyclobacillus macrosporangiidus TaxID=392015 RepID=A0A1I7I5X0_9BACL|nr:DNA repair protein RadA [Alicyclobacillus macrosporangiidus]SFU68136.1 DNA repair protein RadA/Sms [Alicyclobacillus macrosporangiidus]
MAKTSTKYVCQSCGYEAVKWHGRCPGCGEWNTMEETLVEAPRGRGHLRDLVPGAPESRAQRMSQIPPASEQRFSTGMSECDRVLGGGVVAGSLVLIGGDPGIGKSTLLLQIAHHLAVAGRRVLYVSGEESAGQLRLRAERLETMHENVYVLAETDLEAALRAADELRPDLLIVDSIQTVYRPGMTSAPGSVSQVKECTGLLLRVAKSFNLATFIVGHVTKEGNLAGPRMLEHMVDAVLYFEGERHHAYRVLRAVKNRFGSTNELAIFEMRQEGLREVTNPSEMFLSERSERTPGSAVVAALEGSRPLLLEVQALVTPSSFAAPRRMATGADPNRTHLIIAVLEKRLGIRLQTSDAYVNLAGGVRVDEPAIDLGVAMALVSSSKDVPLPSGDVFVGEVGLTGEVRSVTRLEQRVREADKLGFSRCIVPAHSLRGWRQKGNIQVVGVHTLWDAMHLALQG